MRRARFDRRAERVGELLDVLVREHERRQRDDRHVVARDLREDAVVGEERDDDELREEPALRALEHRGHAAAAARTRSPT